MKINDDVIKVIIEQAKKDAPIESCGLLLGKDDVVTESYWMENIDHSEEHFAFAPKDQFAALKYARSKVEDSRQLAQSPGIAFPPFAGRPSTG